MPAMSAVPGSQAIYSSTAAGLNHFYHLVQNAKNNSNINLVEASWTEIPRYKKDGSVKSNEEFKQEIVQKYGELYFQQNYGNCVGYNTLIDIEGIGEIKIGELYDSL